MECIFLAVERYDYYTIVLRSRLIPLLAQKYKVVVLTPDIDEVVSREREFFQHPNVIYHKTPIHYPRLWSRSDIIRRFCVRTYDHFVTTHESFYRYFYTRSERLSELVGRMCPKNIITPWFFTWIEYLVARPPRDFQALVALHRPQMMIVSTPGYRHLPLTDEQIIFAKRLGIPTVSIYSSFDNSYSMAKFLRQTDYICVWSQTMKREVEEVHRYLPDQIFVVGCLKFDHHFFNVSERRMRSREEFLKSKNLDPSKKTVVYCTTIPSFFKLSGKLMEVVVEMKQSGSLKGNPNLLVRIHPFDFGALYDRFRGRPGIHIERTGRLRCEECPGSKVEMYDQDLINQTETLLYADVVINFSSTTTLEACILDTPVVSIGWPERFKQVYRMEVSKALCDTGVESNAQSPEEFTQLINKFLEGYPELDREKRLRVTKDYITYDDGVTYQRTAEVISEILAREQKSSEDFELAKKLALLNK